MLTDSEVNKRFRHAPTLGYNKRVEWLADQIILNFSILCVIIRTGIVFFIISRQHFFFLATLVLKKEQERQEEDREKETLKKITSLFFFAIFGNARHLVTWSLVSLISPIDRYKPVPGVYHAKRSVIENGVIVAEDFEKREKTREICVRSRRSQSSLAFPFRHWPGREVRRKYIWAVKRESKEMDKQWHWDIVVKEEKGRSLAKRLHRKW